MSERNKLFRKGMEILASEGVNPDQAKRMINEAFAKTGVILEKRDGSNNKCMWTNYGTMLEDANGCIETPVDMCVKRNITCDPFIKFRYIINETGKCLNRQDD